MRKISLLALVLSIMCVSAALVADTHSREKPVYNDFSIFDFYVPKLPTNDKPELKTLHLQDRFFWCMQNADIDITVMHTTSIGTYYITAYCPSECGWNGDPDNLTGWYTASGEICHRADHEDRLTEPTTCAIDRHYHSFGDMFYIAEFDRVFVAEDTGSGVVGKHLDLFYEDYYSDVVPFPTGYYEVFSVEYETITIRLGG